jgi:hypothetical protein
MHAVNSGTVNTKIESERMPRFLHSPMLDRALTPVLPLTSSFNQVHLTRQIAGTLGESLRGSGANE